MSPSEDVAFGVLAQNMGLVDPQQLSQALHGARSCGTSLGVYLVNTSVVTTDVYEQIASTCRHFARRCVQCHQTTYLDPRSDTRVPLACEHCGGTCDGSPETPPQPRLPANPRLNDPPAPVAAQAPSFAPQEPPKPKPKPPPSRSFPKRQRSVSEVRRELAEKTKTRPARKPKAQVDRRPEEQRAAPWKRSSDRVKIPQEAPEPAAKPEPPEPKQRSLSMSDSEDDGEPKSFFKRFDVETDLGAAHAKPLPTPAEPEPGSSKLWILAIGVAVLLVLIGVVRAVLG